MDETTISQVNPQPLMQSSASGNKKLFLSLIIVVIVLLLLFGAGMYLRSKNEAIPTPTPFPTAVPTETPTPTPTSTPGKPTPTKKPAATTTNASASASASKGLTLRVLNGSGIAGRAATLADYLKGLGYDIGGTGNADTSDLDSTTISIKSAKASLLPTLKSDIATKFQVGTTSATLSSTETVDAIVTIGKN